MIEYNFTIPGNQEKPEGNPLPYYRQTQRSAHVNAGAAKYHAWKDYVRKCFADGTGLQFLDKPFMDPVKARLEIDIYFKGEVHADPDNIAKGILDSLFANDKHADIATSHHCGNWTKGYITGRIIIYDNTNATP